jgi:ADP-ribose pyrophosphatase
MKKIVPENAILIPPEAKRVFGGVIFDVYQWQQRLFDGSTTTYEQLRRPDTVLVVGIVDDKIVLIDDEQAGRGKVLRLPGGRVETTDESTLAAARREMLEETGYDFASWRLVEVTQPESKLEWFVYIYVADVANRQKQPQNDGGEKITEYPTDIEDVTHYTYTNRGLMDKNRELLSGVKTLNDLRNIAEFQGKEIDR